VTGDYSSYYGANKVLAIGFYWCLRIRGKGADVGTRFGKEA